MDIIDSIYQGTAYMEGWKYSGQPVHTCLSVREAIKKAYNAALEEAAKVAEQHDCGPYSDECWHQEKIKEAILKLKA